ncbi:hypothetical protein M407DRAFT_26871 [Tulasnella calospora MUT 4182]|uniref:Uncharacterized protein n=1 Tax=Tulasnella calospora MUT 4182 TaxID=1051891 RepID=A0A0C3QEW8_9AGAM|nr:hypothetical protein M407DRAFT_26871 [Tulasnella calospora MUT 4182]
MSLAPLSRPTLIFDGSDPSISFNTFLIQLLKESRGDVQPVDVVPARLYGNALRFFESLDILCQQNASKLLDVMGYRFPGQRITQTQNDQQLDDQTIPTLAAAPPPPVRYTFALYKSPSFSTPELSSLGLKGNESKSSLMALKRSNIFAGWRDKLHVNIRPFRPKTPPPPQTVVPLDITVHSFFIEQFPSRHHPGPGTLIAQIDLNDRQAVEQTKNKQLVSVHKYHTTEYRAGFTYSIRSGTAHLILEHNPLSPKPKVHGNVKPKGPREISPLGPIIRRDAIEIFHQDRSVLPGKYQINSLVEEGLLETRAVNDKLGAIQWWIEVTDS